MGNFDLKSFMSTELLKSAKGGNKESIYKNEIFAEVEDIEDIPIISIDSEEKKEE